MVAEVVVQVNVAPVVLTIGAVVFPETVAVAVLVQPFEAFVTVTV